MSISADVHPPFDGLRHRTWAADGRCHAFAVLKFTGLNIFFTGTDQIDAVAAELAAMRAELAAELGAPDEGSEVAWDGAAATGRPCLARWPNREYAGGKWTCTRDAGHDGDHEAGIPADGRPFYSCVSQDDEEVTWDDEPAKAAS